MKKILGNFIIIFLLCMPVTVLAESSVKLDCSSTNTAGQVLSCSVSIGVDKDVSYDAIEATITATDATVTFKPSSGYTGKLENGKLAISGTGNNIGNLEIQYPINISGTKEINLSNIKLLSEDKEVAKLNDVKSNVTVKSNVNTLESLTLSDCNGCSLSPNFKSDLTIYVVTTTTNKITFNAKASGNATVTGDGTRALTKDSERFEIVVTSEAGNKKKYKITVKKEAMQSNDNSLKSLTIDSGTLKPSFDGNTTSYAANVDEDFVEINAVANSDKATISGLGKKELKYGKNEFTVVVTAEDKSSKSYLITINRTDTRNANAYLKEIIINDEKLEFEKDVVEYSYILNDGSDKLDIEAIPEQETSEVKIEGNENLEIGENIVTITVIAEDESEKVYTIVVTKEEKTSSSEEKLYLEKLEVEGYNIGFSKDKDEYTIEINDETSLNINALAANEEHRVMITGNKDLQDGSIIKIMVEDELGNSNIYKLRIVVANQENVSQDKQDINYIPIIMTSLLVILAILDIIQIVKKISNKKIAK